MFGSSLAALISFWTIKDIRPSGHAVLWALYGILIGSTLVWLLAELLRRRESKRHTMLPGRPLETPPGPPAMFHVGHLGEGHFSDSSGHILRAGRVDKLRSEENRGPTTQAIQGEPREPTKCGWWRFILANWPRGRRSREP